MRSYITITGCAFSLTQLKSKCHKFYNHDIFGQYKDHNYLSRFLIDFGNVVH